jgi:manganese transport protein
VNALLAAAGPRAARLRRGALLLGPAFVAAAAYLDPGNVATNTAAGARYGYLLVWVIVVANLMAGLVQYLSAKLGLVTGESLPEALRDRMSRPSRLAYWVQAELVCVATDLAEVLGGAIALHLLFGLPLLVGGVVTTVVSTLVLAVADRRGQRGFEYVITAMLAVVAVGFLTGLVLRPPDPGATAAGLVPAFTDTGSVLLAAGMLGATVMPHAIYLHSSLARDRHGRPAAGPDLRRLLTATKADVSIALLLAGAVNLGLVLLGAAALAGDPRTDTLDGVHAALGDQLGTTAAVLFAVALLFSGLASTSVGCYAGAVVMGGLLRVRVPLLGRRLVTLVPAIVLLATGISPTWLLVISQVVLSFGIPFVMVPLVRVTRDAGLLGRHRNAVATQVAAWVVTGVIVTLNVTLLWLTFTGA